MRMAAAPPSRAPASPLGDTVYRFVVARRVLGWAAVLLTAAGAGCAAGVIGGT